MAPPAPPPPPLPTRKLGSQGCAASAIGLGCMSLVPGGGFYDPENLTEEQAVAVLRRAMDLGVTLVRACMGSAMQHIAGFRVLNRVQACLLITLLARGGRRLRGAAGRSTCRGRRPRPAAPLPCFLPGTMLLPQSCWSPLSCCAAVQHIRSLWAIHRGAGGR